jgi:hypothetical protein
LSYIYAMPRLIIILIFICITNSVFAQHTKEQIFYSYIQNVISKELGTADSLIIDYLPRNKVEKAWQARVRVKSDSCFVTLYPPQNMQDTIETSKILPFNSLSTKKTVLIAGLEAEKNALKKASPNPGHTVDIFVTYGDMLKFLDGNREAYKMKEFTLTGMDGLYRRFRGTIR